MLKKVEDYISKWDMLSEGDKIIVGVSGGADSVCLLFVLQELQKKIPFEMVVVHVNHGLRGKEADRDENYVKTICEENGFSFELYREDVNAVAKKEKQSLEEAGREVRRKAFMCAMKKHKGNKIALAHHMNDNVETFFMNAARGSGLKGLGGIRPLTECYIRPLLCLERKDIEQFLRQREIVYCIDATNDSDCYTRNRVRNKIISYMEEEVNVRTVAHISETMSQLQELQEYIDDQVKKSFESCVKQQKKGYIVLERAFLKVPKVLKPFVLKEVLVKICRKEKDIGEIHLKSIAELMEKQVGRQVDLPYEMCARRTYDGIFISVVTEKNEEPPIFVLDFSNSNKQEFLWKEKRIVCRLMGNVPGEEQLEKSNTKRFDYDIMAKGVCLRTRLAGDYITIHPDGRTQKVKSLFINEKIPQEMRNDILLVAEGSHVIWVEGIRTNVKYQVSEHTKRVLEIQIDKGENYGREH